MKNNKNKVAILITRAEPDVNISVKNWQQAGLNAIAAPLTQFNLLENKIIKFDKYRAVIFTSANGVRAIEQLGLGDSLKNLPAFCVGENSAKWAREFGFINVKSAKGNVKDLIKLLKQNKNEISGDIIYPCAKHISQDLQKLSKPFGLFVEHLPIYEMQLIKTAHEIILDRIKQKEPLIIACYSLRSARMVLELIKQKQQITDFSFITIICLSKRIFSIFAKYSFNKLLIAKKSNDEAMMALALSLTND